MRKQFIAEASVKINASKDKVWEALVKPEIIKKYMFDTNVVSDFKEGSSIVWKGEWQGKSYEDKGKILNLIPEKLIEYSHFSPMMGLADVPENYSHVTIELFDENPGIIVALSQDNNKTEEAKDHSEQNWYMMLESLKKLLEQ